ncbi:OmpA family protein [Nitrospira sp. M1]
MAPCCSVQRSDVPSSIRLGVLMLSLLLLVVGCSSRQHTRVNSVSPLSDTASAQLEETSIEAPLPILPIEKPKDELVQSQEAEDQLLPLDAPADLSDVFASSGEGSREPLTSLPQSAPISELAKPDDLKGIPYGLSDIFFDYDQYILRGHDLSALETNAKVLLGRYPEKKVLIQGHCDERGTEEYNLVLGVRRAQAVKDYLADLGVPPENMQVLSYGKSKPFCSQHSAKCWKDNRRSHFVFQE